MRLNRFTSFSSFSNPSNLISRSDPPNGVPVCYFPNHEIAADNYACDLSSAVSFCCGVDSICLDNKICQNNNNEHIRGACTDQSWDSPDCPQYCTGASTGGTDIISCQNVTNSPLDYCCDHTNDCCDTGVGRFRLSDAGVPTRTLDSSAQSATLHISSSSSSTSSSSTTTSSSTSSSSSLSTAAEATSQTPTPSASPTTNPTPPSSGLSTGAKIGIGVAIPVIVIGILLSALFLWRKSRRKALRPNHPHGNTYEKPELSAQENSLAQTDPQELIGEARLAAEVDGARTAELPVESRWELPSPSTR